MGTLERPPVGPPSPGVGQTAVEVPPGYVLMPTAQAQASEYRPNLVQVEVKEYSQ